jgi:hypothetical protein
MAVAAPTAVALPERITSSWTIEPEICRASGIHRVRMKVTFLWESPLNIDIHEGLA